MYACACARLPVQYELTVTYPLAKPALVQTMYIKSFTMDKSVGTTRVSATVSQ